MLRWASVDHESLVIILSAGGSPLDGGSLAALSDASVVWVRVECEGRAACLAARVRHGDPPDAFRNRGRRVGGGPGGGGAVSFWPPPWLRKKHAMIWGPSGKATRATP